MSAVWRLAAVLGVAFLCEYAVWRFSSRLYRRLGNGAGPAGAGKRVEAASASGPQAQAADDGKSPVSEEGAEGTESESADGLPLGARAEERAREESGETSGVETPGADTHAAHRPAFARLRPFQGGWPLLSRLPFILGAMIVDALPPLAFFAAATLVLASPVINDILMSLMIAAVVNAYVMCRLLLVLARSTFCAPSAKLRLLHLSDGAAAFLAVWCRRIALVFVVGFAIIQIGGLSGMSFAVQHGLGRMFGLAIHIMVIVMILKRRRQVEGWLRGAAGEKRSFWHNMKARLAGVWHWQAILIVALSWILFATEVTNRVQHPTRLILGTLAILVLFRVLHIVLLGALEKAFASNGTIADPRRHLIAQRIARYQLPLRLFINAFMILSLAIFLMQFWGLNLLSWLAVGGLGGRLVSSLGTIGTTLIVGIVIWETLNFVMQIYMDELAQQGAYVRAARLKTVVPILRNTVLIALLAIFVLTVLSEIGVNIGPLLAGASIIGVAVGFGSQKLVQDFINGIFLLLENTMQVGDWVTAGGLSGTVENLSIRTLRLRASDGSVHIIPFSSVTTVTNTNRGLGNAAVSVSVSYDEDTDQVAELLKQIVLDMRQEDAFRDGMLSDLQYWGVDKIDGTVATLAGQVVCTDKARWAVQRELNRRIKIAFQERGLRIMPTANVLAFQHPLDVRVEVPGAAEAAAARLAAPEARQLPGKES